MTLSPRRTSGSTAMDDYLEQILHLIETKGYARSEFSIRWKLFKYRLTQDNIRTTLFLPKNHLQVDDAIRLILEMKLSKHMSAESPTLFEA